MKPNDKAGIALPGIGFLIVFFLILLLSPGAVSADGKVASQLPDVLLWIYARTPTSHFVSITYPRVINRADAEKQLGQLLLETGWTAGNINITDGTAPQPGETPMTTVEFSTPLAVDQTSGILSIEPLIKAFRTVKALEILYVLPPTGSFRAVGDFENRYVKINLSRGTGTYNYKIVIKDSDFQTLGLPSLQPGNAVPSKGGSPSLFAISLVVILAVLTATLAFVLVGRAAGSTRANRNQRS